MFVLVVSLQQVLHPIAHHLFSRISIFALLFFSVPVRTQKFSSMSALLSGDVKYNLWMSSCYASLAGSVRRRRCIMRICRVWDFYENLFTSGDARWKYYVTSAHVPRPNVSHPRYDLLRIVRGWEQRGKLRLAIQIQHNTSRIGMYVHSRICK